MTRNPATSPPITPQRWLGYRQESPLQQLGLQEPWPRSLSAAGSQAPQPTSNRRQRNMSAASYQKQPQNENSWESKSISTLHLGGVYSHWLKATFLSYFPHSSSPIFSGWAMSELVEQSGTVINAKCNMQFLLGQQVFKQG